jgi:hypothetical protein
MDRLGADAIWKGTTPSQLRPLLSGLDCEYSTSVAGFLGLTPCFDRHKRDTARRGDMARKPL